MRSGGPLSPSVPKRVGLDWQQIHRRYQSVKQISVLNGAVQPLSTWSSCRDWHRRRGVTGRRPADDEAVLGTRHRKRTILASKERIEKPSAWFIGVRLIL